MREITLGIKKDDPTAFEKLFYRFYPEMVKSAFIILKEEDLAKEAAQQAFISTWKNRHNFDENKSLKAYIKKATISRSLNILKSTKHHRGVGQEALLHKKDTNSNPLKNIENEELKISIRNAVNQLPKKCRLVFILARYEGYSHKEIAKELEISTKTVENHMGKALKILRKQLANYRLIIFLFELGGIAFSMV